MNVRTVERWFAAGGEPEHRRPPPPCGMIDRVTPPWLIDGPINGERFQLYVEEVLVPILPAAPSKVCDAIGTILNRITADECSNYFANSGYDPK
ncbi:hypothetical protein BPNPMPFG_007127 (plasmid) [Mesorhizobium sp. AR07]|nr:hypothetical protein [Mesorhizobium sp. AR07]UVK48690.1 hypothetical protein BPNPMPFG_007127 [Mesorhizobium sp. AR07]